MQFTVSIKKEFPNKLIEVFIANTIHFKGSWLIYSFAFSLIPREKRMVRLSVSDYQKELFFVVLDPANPPQLSMLMKDYFDLGTALTMWSLLEQGDTCLDVGANSGFFSAIVAQRISATGKVVAIEPNPRAFRWLTKLSYSQIAFLNKAAGKQSGTKFKIVQPFYRQTTSSRFVESQEGSVESICLDDVYKDLGNPPVKLIKIDTEGAELFVLEGAAELLKREHPLVITEAFGHSGHFKYDDLAIYEYMKGFGYTYFYEIDDDTNSLKKLNEPKTGQILFSTYQLPETLSL